MRSRFSVEFCLAILIVAISLRIHEVSGSLVYSTTGRQVSAEEGLASFPASVNSRSLRNPNGSWKSIVCTATCASSAFK
jgi:hypothetical protein